MIELLLSAQLTCEDASALIARARQSDMPAIVREEIVRTIKDSLDGRCFWSQPSRSSQ